METSYSACLLYWDFILGMYTVLMKPFSDDTRVNGVALL